MITFTHTFTGKTITILDKRAISAIIHGDATRSDGTGATPAVFLVIDKVPQPLPVRESEAEVLEKLGLLPANKEIS
jgi:hypothetical protein